MLQRMPSSKVGIVISCGVQGKKDQQVATIVRDKLEVMKEVVRHSECCYRLLNENRHRRFWNYCITCSVTMYRNLGLDIIVIYRCYHDKSMAIFNFMIWFISWYILLTKWDINVLQMWQIYSWMQYIRLKGCL